MLTLAIALATPTTLLIRWRFSLITALSEIMSGRLPSISHPGKSAQHRRDASPRRIANPTSTFSPSKKKPNTAASPARRAVVTVAAQIEITRIDNVNDGVPTNESVDQAAASFAGADGGGAPDDTLLLMGGVLVPTGRVADAAGQPSGRWWQGIGNDGR